jgi:POT family proton-dependent oligopeptide transporter
MAGRVRLDPASHTLQMRGVLSDTERDEMVRATAPPAFVKNVEELRQLGARGPEAGDHSVRLDQEPPGFDLRYAGFKRSAVWYDSSTHTLHAALPLADKDVKALLVAAGDSQFRDTLSELMVQSSKYRVSAWWLFWFYILATLGELCLSPVGLSMVSKLAPARFATMLMGLWMLTSFFGNFVAGAFGEQWGTVPPAQFFAIFLVALGAASLVLFVLVRKIVAMMHGVN